MTFAPAEGDAATFEAGSGTGAEATFSTTLVRFSMRSIGSTTYQTVQLTNTGTETMLIRRLIVRGADYSEMDNCPFSLATGANCSITIYFRPTQSGFRPGTLVLGSTAWNSPTSVALRGSGAEDPTQPSVAVTIDPATISTDHGATLSWTTRNVTTCSASGAWSGVRYTSGADSVFQFNPGTYVYTLTCTDGVRAATGSATLTVVTPQVLETTLSAERAAVARGASTTLTWDSAGADACEASGAWSGSLPPSGSQLVTVPDEGSNAYGLQCRSATGNGTAATTIEGLVATVNLSAEATTVGAGQSTVLHWTSTNAHGCTAFGAWSGTLAASGSQIVTPTAAGAQTYRLGCSRPGARTVASVTVTAVDPSVSLQVFPAKVVAGRTVTLRWDARYATSCTATGQWDGELPVDGERTVTVTAAGTADYHLECANLTGSDSADVAVTVETAPAFPPATAYRMTERHEGVLHAADASVPTTSAPSWTRTFTAPVSYPLIAEGLVFVATAMPGSSYGNQLYALSAATGQTVWGPVTVAGTYFGSGLSYADGKVFLLMFDGGLYAFNAADGAALWTAQLPGYWYEASPNAYGGLVFVAGNGGLSAVDAGSGQIAWTTGYGTTDWSSPAVSSAGIYFMDGCVASAHDPRAGSTLWSQAQPCSGSFGHTPIVKGDLFFGRNGGSVVLADAHTGTSKVSLGSARAPAVTDNAMITVNAETLSSTRLSDFVQTWTFSGDGRLSTSPVVVNDTVFVASGSGKVYGVDATTGLQVWSGSATYSFDESESGGPRPPAGPAAGEGLLIFTGGNSLAAWKF